jgi:GAF domain-containing protein
MTGRFNPVFAERLGKLGDTIHATQFAELLDPLLREVLADGFTRAGAHEGTVWLADAAEEHLEPAYNTGPQSAQLVGRFKQPLSAGLISMVFATEQPFLENAVSQNARQSKLLDTRLRVQTLALIAVPFHFLNACRGVISCVQLARPGPVSESPRGFRPEDLTRVQAAASLAAQLIEFRLLSRALAAES